MEYLIIGGSAAGVYAAEAIRKIDKKSNITLVSDEKLPFYSRCLLSYLIAGEIEEDALKFKHEDFYEANKINTILGIRATQIDEKKKKVTLSNKKSLAYDKLLLATGSSAKRIDVAGVDKKGVFNVRTIDDAEAMLAVVDNTKKVCVLGGGLIGLRVAYALRKRGKEVSVIVKSNQILSQMLDKGAADLVQKKLDEHGIKFMLGLEAAEIKGGTKVEGIALDNGEKIDCEMLVIGKGVAANTELAEGTAIKVDSGFIVDENLKTTASDIFAAGDCAETIDIPSGERRINALWPVAAEQGRIAGLNMAGEEVKYEGSLGMNSLDFFGLAIISCGITRPKGEGFEEIVWEDAGRSLYRKVVLKNDIICGMEIVGNVKNAGILNILIQKKINVSSIKDLIVQEAFDYAKVLPLIKQHEKKFGKAEFKETLLTYSSKL